MTSVPLSPIDHIFTGVGSYPIEFVFAYDGQPDEQRLRDSLAETVARFSPVASRLVRISHDSYGLEPSEEGLVFTTADADEPYAGLDNAHRFLEPVRTVEGEPLTRIRLTRTRGGSVLGVSMSHAVADGFSYFLFLSCWARAFRGDAGPDPIHDRRLLIPDLDEDAGPMDPEDVLRDSGIHWGERRAEIQRDRMQWDRLAVSRELANEWLREAREHGDGRLSLNDVISARLWREYVEKWDPHGREGLTFLACPVDFRRTLRPFPSTYFGCAVCLATAVLERRRLGDVPLGKLASLTRSAVAAVDGARVWKALRTLEALRRQEGLPALESAHVIPPNGLLVTNLSRLPVPEVRFDVGPPTAFDILTPAERGAVILPADRGFDVRVCYPMTEVRR